MVSKLLSYLYNIFFNIIFRESIEGIERSREETKAVGEKR